MNTANYLIINFYISNMKQYFAYTELKLTLPVFNFF